MPSWLIVLGFVLVPGPLEALHREATSLTEKQQAALPSGTRLSPRGRSVAGFLQKPRRTGAEEAPEGEKVDFNEWPLWLKIVVFGSGGICLAACCGWWLFELCTLWCRYRKILHYHERAHDGDEDTITFKEYLKYRFAYWFVWTSGSNGIVIVVAVLVTLMVGALLYCLCLNSRIVGAFWRSFVWLVAPDAGAQESTLQGAAIGAMMSIAGLVLFALLLTLMQDSFKSYLDRMRNNSSGIMETGHIILLGITETTMPIIQELCKAYECCGGTTIVVLSSTLSKPDMEHKIMNSGIEHHRSRIVVRAGQPSCEADLRMVSADSAKSIVIMADRDQPKEIRDAFVMRSLIGLRGKGWPVNGRILAVCSLVRNKTLLELTGGDGTDVLMLDSFVGKLMVQCSKHQGLGPIVKETFGFDGSEFYIAQTPKHLRGKTLGEVALYYPSAVICGVIGPGDDVGCKLCPGNDYTLELGEELVLLATDSACVIAQKAPTKPPQVGHLVYTSPSLNPGQTLRDKPEKILIMGWNEKTGYIINELDGIVAPGTEVVLVSPASNHDERYLQITSTLSQKKTLENITFKQVQGIMGSRWTLEELPDNAVTEASRIFILGDDDAVSAKDADTGTIGVLMQIRDIIVDSKAEKSMQENPVSTKIPIIPEIQDPESEMHCQMIQACDFIDTSGLPSKILAMVAYNPRINTVLDQILSESSDIKFAIRKLQEYIQPGTEPPSCISFAQVQYLASQSGDVVVGWTLPSKEDHPKKAMNTPRSCPKRDFANVMREQASCSTPVVDWEINPNQKHKERAWNASIDSLVVLCSHKS